LVNQFIALLAERTPSRRVHFNDSLEEFYILATRVGLQDKSSFERFLQHESKKNDSIPTNVTYEQIMDLIDSDDYRIKFNNNFHMDTLMTRIDAIIQPLGQRKWSVVYSPHRNKEFICSDNPVSLRFTKEVKGFFNSPGHGLLNTEVSVPLSPNIALLGRFKDYHPPSGIIPNRRTAAIINSNTGRHAKRFVFSKSQQFIWYDMEGIVSNTEDFKTTTARLISKDFRTFVEGI
jgi:hypothetical protein